MTCSIAAEDACVQKRHRLTKFSDSTTRGTAPWWTPSVMAFLTLLLLAGTLVSGASAANISDSDRSLHIAFVAIAPHVKDSINLAAELARRGHTVTVASYGHNGDQPTTVKSMLAKSCANLTNPIRFLDTGALPAELNMSAHIAMMMDGAVGTREKLGEFGRWWGGVNLQMARQLRSEWSGRGSAGSGLKTDRPDFVISDPVTFAGVDVADLLGIPHGLISCVPAISTANLLGYRWGLGGSAPWLGMSVQQSSDMGWASRVFWGMLKAPLLAIMQGPLLPPGRARNALRAELGLEPIGGLLHAVPIRGDGGAVSQPLIVVSRPVGLDPVIALPPNWVLVPSLTMGMGRAGAGSPASSASLDAETEAWFRSFAGGVVVASFGRMLVLSEKAVRTIVDAAELLNNHKDGPTGVYFALRDRALLRTKPDLPANLRVEAWIEQRAALEHANTRAFLTHGGASSLEEGITAGLPLVLTPFGGDQKLNGRVAEDAGLGVTVVLEKITAEELAAAIVRVGITEPGFRAKALRLQRLARDADGVRVAADAVESAARWGTEHLSSRMDAMSWFFRNDYDLLLVALVLAYAAARATLALGSRFVKAFAKSATSRSPTSRTLDADANGPGSQQNQKKQD